MYTVVCGDEKTQNYYKYFCKEKIRRRDGLGKWGKNLTIV